MSDKRLEEAYFHFGNGGYTFTLFERDWCIRMNVDMNHHGSHMAIELPVSTVAMVDWLVEALGRVREQVGNSPKCGPDYIVEKGAPAVTFRGCEAVKPEPRNVCIGKIDFATGESSFEERVVEAS